jgi:hypothetical protein
MESVMTDLAVKTGLTDESGTGLRKLEGPVVAALLVVGLYCPTSTTGTPSKVLLGLDYVICAMLFLLLMVKRRDLPSVPSRLAFFAIIPLLLVFTAVFGLREQSFGEMAVFAMVTLLWMLNLRSVRLEKWLYPVFSAVNVVNIVLGIAVLAGSSVVGGFLSKYHAQFDVDMVPGMVLMRKPVLTFAAHSMAAFFYYLFFHANFRTYRVLGKKFFLAIAIGYLLLTVALLSVTGLLLGAFGTLQIFIYFWRRVPYRWYAVAACVGASGILLGLWHTGPALRQWNETVQTASSILLSQQNGFLGRLSPTGTMYPVLQYIRAHPFSPLGFSRDSTIMTADVGLIAYFVRGSIFLVLWAYGGLFLFLRRSLLEKQDLWFVFGLILAFETGFSIIGYFRMLFLLPFFVVYLNELRRHAGAESIMKSAKAA